MYLKKKLYLYLLFVLFSLNRNVQNTIEKLNNS